MANCFAEQAVLLQVLTLASLIVGSWINLQRQLDLLQRDVTMLLESQKINATRLDTISGQSLAHEYRLQAVEKGLGAPGQSERPTF